MGIKISACIITYNQEPYIRQCLDGALSQQLCVPYEIVIGEDRSTDGTAAICREYAEKYPDLIRFKTRSKNLGMAGNWLATLSECRGEYIAICEGDDYWTDPGKLQKQVDFLESNPDYALTFHDVKIQKADGSIGDDFITTVPADYESRETLARLGNYIHTPSVVFRNVVKEWPFEMLHSPIMDYFLYLVVTEYGKIKQIDGTMAVYRHGSGVLSTLNGLKIQSGMARFYSCVLSWVSDQQMRKIFLDRQLDLLKRHAVKNQESYSANAWLSANKSYFDLLKISVRKIIGKTG